MNSPIAAAPERAQACAATTACLHVDLTTRMPVDVAVMLTDLARAQGIGVSEALHRAVVTEHELRQLVAQGARLLLEDDRRRVVTFKTAP